MSRPNEKPPLLWVSVGCLLALLALVAFSRVTGAFNPPRGPETRVLSKPRPAVRGPVEDAATEWHKRNPSPGVR